MSDQSKITFEPDDRSQESLVERLRHPAFSYSVGDCFLDEEITINDMKDAADEIERLRVDVGEMLTLRTQLASARKALEVAHDFMKVDIQNSDADMWTDDYRKVWEAVDGALSDD